MVPEGDGGRPAKKCLILQAFPKVPDNDRLASDRNR